MQVVSINNMQLPAYNNSSRINTARSAMTLSAPLFNNYASERRAPSINLRISPEARAFSANSDLLSRLAQNQPAQNPASIQRISGIFDAAETAGCLMCAERKYVDKSADASVSFQMPVCLSRETAPAAVRAHEREHIVNERDRAEREGRRVLSQSVVIHMDICEECGKAYVAGGEARTATAPKNQQTAMRAYEAMQNMLDALLPA